MTFPTLLRRLQKSHFPKSAKSFADALQMHHSRVYRAMQARGVPFDMRGCLRLAEVTGADLFVILRAAGKTDIADALQRLQLGPLQGVSPARRRLADVCDQLREDQIRYVTLTLEVLTLPPADAGDAGSVAKATTVRRNTSASAGTP